MNQTHVTSQPPQQANAGADWQPQTMPAILIAGAARALARLSDARFRDMGISTSQLPVLAALKNGAQLPQKDLAIAAGVEQSSMAQLLNRMERDGLVQRTSDPNDKRSSLISLTNQALDLLPPARAVLQRGNQEALLGFSESEKEMLVQLLLKLMANICDGTTWSPTGCYVAPRPQNNIDHRSAIPPTTSSTPP